MIDSPGPIPGPRLIPRWNQVPLPRLNPRWKRLFLSQAALLEQAIANYRKARKLMQAWEDETEKLIVAEAPRIES